MRRSRLQRLRMHLLLHRQHLRMHLLLHRLHRIRLRLHLQVERLHRLRLLMERLHRQVQRALILRPMIRRMSRMLQLRTQSRLRLIPIMLHLVLYGTMAERTPTQEKFRSICIRKSNPVIIRYLERTRDT